MDYTLNFGAVFRGFDDLLAGLALGLEMGLAGLVVGSVIGVLAALAAIYGGRPARILVAAYVGLIRNVPILVLALFAFFALPGIGIRFSNVVTFAAVLAIYAGAYLTESFRAAILVSPRGITEAAQSIGLTRTGAAIWVILPIALRNALPSVGNNFISLFNFVELRSVLEDA
jgi:polar amino acid transport system permease protein